MTPKTLAAMPAATLYAIRRANFCKTYGLSWAEYDAADQYDIAAVSRYTRVIERARRRPKG